MTHRLLPDAMRSWLVSACGLAALGCATSVTSEPCAVPAPTSEQQIEAIRIRSPLAAVVLTTDVDDLMAIAKQSFADAQRMLVIASGLGRMEIVKSLLEVGIPANSIDSEGRSALQSATVHGCPAVARLLLKAGADADLADPDGRTPLFTAVAMSDEELTAILLEFGADPTQSVLGVPVTDIARNSGNWEVVEMLARAIRRRK